MSLCSSLGIVEFYHLSLPVTPPEKRSHLAPFSILLFSIFFFISNQFEHSRALCQKGLLFVFSFAFAFLFLLLLLLLLVKNSAFFVLLILVLLMDLIWVWFVSICFWCFSIGLNSDCDLHLSYTLTLFVLGFVFACLMRKGLIFWFWCDKINIATIFLIWFCR